MYAPPKAVFEVPAGYYLYDPLFDGTDWDQQPAGATRRISSHIACSDLALQTLNETEGLAFCRLSGKRYILHITAGDCQLTCVDATDARFTIGTAQLLQNHWVLLRLDIEDAKNDNARVFLNTRVAADALVAPLACFSPVQRKFYAGPYVITGFPDTINYCARPCKCGIFISKLKGSVLFVSSHNKECDGGFSRPLSQVLVYYNENALYVTNTPAHKDAELPFMVSDPLPQNGVHTLAVAVVPPLSADSTGLHASAAAEATPEEDNL